MKDFIDIFGGAIGIIIVVFGIWAFFVVLALFVRWLFRINEIAGYLRRLADRLAPDLAKIVPVKKEPPPPKELQFRCNFCNKSYPVSILIKLSSGKMVCPYCLKQAADTRLKPNKANNL